MDVLIFCIGACIGSFLGVCIYRIPRNISIVYPRSQCQCGKSIPFYHNIPIISWLILRGTSKCCKTKIPTRGLIIEILTAILFLTIWKISSTMSEMIVRCLLSSLLLVIAFIDIDTMEIPDSLSIGGMILGILSSIIAPCWISQQTITTSLQNSILGICFSSGLLLWIAIISEYILNREAIGFGDIKLIGTIGSFVGWKGTMFALFGGCCIGTLFALPLLSLKICKKYRDIKHEVPFAPFLALGTMIYLLFGQEIISFYKLLIV